MLKTPIKVIIVDDDSSAREILKKFLSLDKRINIVDSVEDAEEAYRVTKRRHPDVIFLDINMPNENGLEFATKLQDENIDVDIVFTTAYSNYAGNAFNLKPVDYLVKPFGPEDLQKVIDKLERVVEEKYIDKGSVKIFGKIIKDKVALRVYNGIIFLHPDEIIYCQSDSNASNLYLSDGTQEKLFLNLNGVFDKLRHLDFYKINRSNIINLKYIKNVDRRNKLCHVEFGDIQLSFKVTRDNLKFFERVGYIKLG